VLGTMRSPFYRSATWVAPDTRIAVLSGVGRLKRFDFVPGGAYEISEELAASDAAEKPRLDV
jgi:hypothetical protein